MDCQMTKISDYVVKYNLFDPEHCSDIITFLEKYCKWRPHEWYNNYEDIKDTFNDFSVTDNENLSKQFQTPIQKCLIDYANTKMGKFPQPFFNTHVRFNKYSIEEGIEEHVDHIHAIFKSRPSGIPILSLVGCLNDDYEGGVFHLCEEPIDIKAGEFIIFPSLFIYPHYVTPVTKGHRYSWVSWAC